MPKYILEYLRKSEYRPFENKQYAHTYEPNYDSPYLLNRYKKLLSAFSNFLDGFIIVNNRKIQRKQLIEEIEMGYMGFWGEGSTTTAMYPKTNLFDSYIDLYIKYFPDIQLMFGGQEFLHLPNNKTSKMTVSERHCMKLLKSKNEFGKFGMYIDNWGSNGKRISYMYDKAGKKKINGIPLQTYLDKYIWGKVPISGEHATFTNDDCCPFEHYYEQVIKRKPSSICLTNYTTDGKPITDTMAISQIKKTTGIIGFRIALSNIKIEPLPNKTYNVSCTLNNIGVSRIYSKYWQLVFIVKTSNGEKEFISDFDLRNIVPNENGIPLTLDSNKGQKVSINIPISGKLFLIIRDKYEIAYPMCLSNYGRLSNGSYFLGEL